MGVLYARVAGAWVPVIGSGPAGNVQSIIAGNSIAVDSNDIAHPVVSLISPAYAGPWRSSAGGVDINTASYSNILAGLRKEGMHVDASGYVRFYAKAGDVSGGNQIQFHEVSADHVTSSWIASIFKESFQIGDIVLGRHPAHSMFGLFIRSEVGSGSGVDYLIMRGGGGELYLDCTAGSDIVSIRKGNSPILDIRSGSTTASGQFVTGFTAPNPTFPTAHFFANCSAAGQQARIALNSPGVCPQMRGLAADGEQLVAVNNQASGYCPMGASAFNTLSTQTIKRDIRTLRPERERISVHHDVRADVVPLPDIMSLRPVAFRPKVPALRIIPTKGDTYDATDPTSYESVPQIGILGHEGTRERLGLIAEEVETVIPSAVNHNCDGVTLGIDYAQITVALLDHVQRLTEEIATLRYRITELESA